MIPWNSDGKVVEDRARVADEGYDKVGLARATQKDVSQARSGRLWGPHLDGDHGTVGISSDRLHWLALLTLRALPKRLPGRHWAALLGHWTVALQFRRTAFSVTQEI